MSTLKTENIQHPNALTPNISLTASAMSVGNALYLDSLNNRVGINTASASQALTVNGTILTTTDSNSYLRLGRWSAGFGGAVIDTDSQSSFIEMQIAGAQKMKLDSLGRVTMPGKPMFDGYPTVDRSGGGMPEGVLLFTSVINNGSYYNATNGRFTAPVTGFYRSTFHVLQLNASAFRLRKNGVDWANTNHAVATMSYIITGSSTIVSCNANDYLDMYAWNGGGYYSGWTRWTVELIA